MANQNGRVSTFSSSPLEGVKVLISRPEPAASKLGEQFSKVGAECRLLPAISIRPLPITQALKQIALQLEQFNQVIVISTQAADLGLAFLEQYWPQWPAQQHWYGIGDATNQRLSAYDISPEHPLSTASHFDSETLLEHPQLQKLHSQKILILKGKGGRNVLRDSLSERGAKVVEAALYERSLPSYSIETIQQYLLDFAPAFIVALSAETVENLLILANQVPNQTNGMNEILQRASWILPSKRVAEFAQARQLSHYLLPEALTGKAIIEAILRSNRVK
jgi:uroporphyrinogen-III synthase